MNKFRTLLVVIISILFSMMLFDEVSAKNKGYENYVLYISSYNPNFISFEDQVSGIEKGLKDKVYLEKEYMNFKTIHDEGFREFYQVIQYQLQDNKNIKAVILGDDAALEFGIKYRDELFKNIPLIFLGAQDSENVRLASELDDVYGVVEKPSIEKNLDLISKLHDGKTVVALIDEEPSESKILDSFYELSSKYDNLKFKHISSLEKNGFYDFKEDLNNIDDNHVVLLLNQYKNKSLYYMGIDESSEFIIENISVPAYCIYDYSVGRGFVGGNVISHFEQGKKAGELANDILNDIKPQVKIIDIEDVNKNLFNYETLKKYKISQRELPKDSIIMNSLMSTIEKYKQFIFPIAILSISLILVIVAFIFYYLKKSQYEKALVEAKEIAETSNDAKNHLISNISHELRTPVTVIMLANQLLELNSNDELSSTNKNNLGIIKQNCYRLLRITNNIIDIAKVDTRIIELKPSITNIVSFIEGIVESVIPYAKIKKMNIIFDTNDEEIIMNVDLEKIERIVLNLLSNAIKFSNENDNIYVNIKRVEDKVIISVKDEGIGIPQKYLCKIFEKFTQLDNTMRRKNEGSGIGLSIVKSFVELHGGNISVISNGKDGSEFIVELPIEAIDEEYEIQDEYFNAALASTNVELSDIYF